MLQLNNSGKADTLRVAPVELLSARPGGQRMYVTSYGWRNPTERRVVSRPFAEPNRAFVWNPEVGVHTAAITEVSEDETVWVATTTTLKSMPKSWVRAYFRDAYRDTFALPSVALDPPFVPNVTVEKVGDYWTGVVRPLQPPPSPWTTSSAPRAPRPTPARPPHSPPPAPGAATPLSTPS